VTPIHIRLRELREARGLSQQALGDVAGVRQSAISQLESGTRKRVDLSILERLADALGVDKISDLLVLERNSEKAATAKTSRNPAARKRKA
jgi:putative transcriptional regulator